MPKKKGKRRTPSIRQIDEQAKVLVDVLRAIIESATRGLKGKALEKRKEELRHMSLGTMFMKYGPKLTIKNDELDNCVDTGKPVRIYDARLQRQVDTDKPIKIYDKDPEIPGGIKVTVKFGTLPKINRSKIASMTKAESKRFARDVKKLEEL